MVPYFRSWTSVFFSLITPWGTWRARKALGGAPQPEGSAWEAVERLGNGRAQARRRRWGKVAMGSTRQLFIGERGRVNVGLHPYPHLQPNQRSSRVCYEFGSVFITPRFHFFTLKSSRFAGRGLVGTGTGCAWWGAQAARCTLVGWSGQRGAWRNGSASTRNSFSAAQGHTCRGFGQWANAGPRQ
jgi:hypothetical protein